MKTFATIVIVLALIIGGYLIYRGNNGNPDASPNPTVVGNSPTPTASASPTVSASPTASSGAGVNVGGSVAVGQVKSFTVNASNFKFDPKEIKVKKGDTVRITLKASGMPHDWRVDEFNAKTNVLQSGQQETIEFVANKTGTFEYYCSVGNHRANGMVGKLIVQ